MLNRNLEENLENLVTELINLCKENNIAKLSDETLVLLLLKKYQTEWEKGKTSDIVSKMLYEHYSSTDETKSQFSDHLGKLMSTHITSSIKFLPKESVITAYAAENLINLLILAQHLTEARTDKLSEPVSLEDVSICAVGLDMFKDSFKCFGKLVDKEMLIDFLVGKPKFKNVIEFLEGVTDLHLKIKLTNRHFLSKIEAESDTFLRRLSEDSSILDKLLNDDSGLESMKLGERVIRGEFIETGGCSDEEFESAGRVNPEKKIYKTGENTSPTLDEFSTNLTELALEGKLDPVIGRETEIDQLLDILCCRKKNNAAILGDPGCGKSAVVEGLAQLIVAGKVPLDLKNKEIRQLNLNSLVAGTKFRGEYEERLSQIIKEVSNNKNIIVYIDELHTLVGNGGSQGSGDAANILKPYLGRGEFQCIGATTLDEYNKFIAKDGALKRRFQCVLISEPTPEETVDILKGLRDQYIDYHKVTYTDEVIQACVDWSGRYISDRYFPDKAIDIMDMAGSLTKLSVKMDDSKMNEYLEQVKKLKEQKSTAILAQDFEAAANYRDSIASVENSMAKLTKKAETQRIKKKPVVTLDTVSKVISDITGIPVDTIGKSDLEKLKDLKISMSSKVIGQAKAIDRLTLSLQRNSLGLRDETKPIASLLFVGPTGVGKTHICKELAKDFFGSTKRLIKFDMAEFSSPHEVTKLIGAGPSYVGYDDAPLFEQVRRNPYSVILFDEIEKAAPGIFDILLTILDEGSVTLANGIRVSFKNCIIILTGNIGTKELAFKANGLGFSKKSIESDRIETEAIVTKAVKARFRPELINRLSEIVVFNKLHKEELNQIFELEIKNLEKRLLLKNFQLEIQPDLRCDIIEKCDPQYGARDLQRGIVRSIEETICSAVLDRKTMPKSREIIKVSKIKDGSIKVTFHKLKKKETVEVIKDEKIEEII